MRHPGRLKIAAVSRVTLQHGTSGGLERCLDLVLSGLAKRGHQVTLITTQLPAPPAAPDAFAVESLPSPRASRRAWRQELQKRFRQAGAPADVILSNSFAAAPLSGGPVPIVPLIHGTGLVDLVGAFRLARLGRGSAFALGRELATVLRDGFLEQRSLVRFAPRVIAVSQETLRSLERTYGDLHNRIRVIPSPVDTAVFTPDEGRLFTRPAEGTPLRLFTAATLSRQKGVEDLVAAIGLLARHADARYRLAVAGDGPERLSLEQQAAGLHPSPAIEFLGNVDQETMARHLRQADLFILPTLREEGFPLAIGEALASGIPVVATRAGGNPTAVRQGVDGLLVPCGSPEELAEAIRSLGDDVELRRRMSHNARARAVAELDASVVAASVEAVLCEACGGQ